MSALQFLGYKVMQMKYERNTGFESVKEPISLEPKMTTKINLEDNNINITLSVVVGSLEHKNIPFQVSCSIIGTFVYKTDEDTTKIGLDTLIRNNAVAILYPYVRAIIATLTTTSNEFPGYNMPTINVSKVLAQQDKKRV
ncbi:protein-export chaperone SecB [Lactobacillus sp. UCMA15818]|uniref:protein-export chaperone SecB n=1 Tax=Lactobacillus sp. UCMA15818 TaxID=2583394 RepID=UPI0025AFD3D8|nr:protein-export chaperone SecB [Lactobacillus sp. UCMA15818]MDN2452978.1 hypothetical protein [Lactobacillus sp. UCMA15818]